MSQLHLIPSVLRSSAYLFLQIFLTAQIAHCVIFPPIYSDTDYILRLITPDTNSQGFRYERYYTIENNVISLSEAEKDVYEPHTIETARPYYNQYQLTRYSFQFLRWRLEYEDGTFTSITGNQDAGQLWVDAKSQSIDQTRIYLPSVEERRAYARWWRLEYEAPWKLRNKYKGISSIGLRLIDCHRFREWNFRGTFLQNRLMGDMVLISSRGINFKAPSGRGFALDFLTTLELPKDWRALLGIEGLWGEVHWEKLRRLDAQVETDAFYQDPEGFIHDLPSLTGKETYISLTQRVEPQLLIALARRQSRNWFLGAMFSERADIPNLHIFASRLYKRHRCSLIDIQFPSRTVNLGYAGKSFSLFIGISHPNPKDGTTVNIQSHLSLP